MPISFTEIAGAGDPLPANRHMLLFPSLPGGMNGRELTLRHTTVTLPEPQIGQILVRPFGFPIAFPGTAMITNQFSAEFVETVNSPVVKTIAQWMDKTAGNRSHRGLRKREAAVTCHCIAHDTTGMKSLTSILYNVWPMRMTYGNYVEESTPCHINIEFSVDAVDFAEITYNDEAFSYAGTVSSSNLVSSNSPIQTGSFIASDQVLKSLNVANSGISSIFNTFF